MKFLKIQIKSFWPAAFGLVVATLLFCLPGEEFPQAGWLENLQLDKIIHVGLFFMLVVLWCLPVQHRAQNKLRASLFITLAFIVYGIAIEFIQRDFIPHRSFDIFDIVADTLGCFLGWIVLKKSS
ncbi:VanZ family protein [Chryseolinea sp. H1M3-3]|uniref:VanZ family protein n=1 Tax=Chryseolinea sp. H1M3-3 TaxID=3034144 RepID=UPI0023EAD674|nr:VanZ family protein [Chryseolinea sp. H1M3-3]